MRLGEVWEGMLGTLSQMLLEKGLPGFSGFCFLPLLLSLQCPGLWMGVSGRVEVLQMVDGCWEEQRVGVEQLSFHVHL